MKNKNFDYKITNGTVNFSNAEIKKAVKSVVEDENLKEVFINLSTK